MGPTVVVTPSGPSQIFSRVRVALRSPVDSAGLRAFRVLFGLLIAASSTRLLWSGFLDKLFCEEAFYFRYPGLAWVPVPPPIAIHASTVIMALLGLVIAHGRFFRVATLAFILLYSWVKLVDLTNYLNHEWLVVFLAVILGLSPANARGPVPFCFVALLRFQVACVYGFAALAKAGPDWLLHGQPLGLWLPARDELPLLGALLQWRFAPIVISWCGFLYDATIVPLLLWRRSRKLAYLLVLVFHGLTFALFEIGMFPFIMAVATTVFFDPGWPRRLTGHATASAPSAPLPRASLVFAFVWCALQVFVPLRFLVISENVLWDEAGMRFSWRVMVREKSGSLTYRITLPQGDQGAREVIMSPHDVLTHRQVNEMIGQPDMILQLAHHIRDQFAEKGLSVEVRADSLVSLNARPMQRFVDPTVDLARVQDTWGRPGWILPAPSSPSRSSWSR